MKRLIALLILGGLVYSGWVLYRGYQTGSVPALSRLPVPPSVVLGDSAGSWNNLQSVLGASIGQVVETGKDWVSEATAGQAEPIVNRAVTNFQEELKQLPAEQVEKIKYDFCKPIVDDYEKAQNP